MDIFAYAIKLLVAGLFAHAAYSKLLAANQSYYQEVFHDYGVSKAISALLPRLIGVAELLTAVLLLIEEFSKIGLICAGSLLCLYLFAFITQLAQGRADLNCGCAGPGAQLTISPLLVIRNIVLIVLCLASAVAEQISFSSVWYLILPLAVAMTLIYQSFEQLIINQQKIELIGNT